MEEIKPELRSSTVKLDETLHECDYRFKTMLCGLVSINI